MQKHCSSEKSVQLLISLLKQHGIKKIIASPGTTNITFVGSAMHDPWFEIYSSVDERSAAYMACGLSETSGEPVVLTCTGATASRNYMPGLTEAYYSKLPVLAVTASQDFNRVGNLQPQVLDRSRVPVDVAKKSFTIPAITEDSEIRPIELKLNDALLELRRHGGGPVHLNFMTTYSRDFTVEEPLKANKIDRLTKIGDDVKILEGKVAIFVGRHKKMDKALTEAIDAFCGTNDAVVMCDHTSGYYGKYRVGMSLAFDQRGRWTELRTPDLLIHIGEVSGDYATLSIDPKQVWRVSEDGELRDTFGKLTKVFEMPELDFFQKFGNAGDSKDSLLKQYQEEDRQTRELIPELPFSNPWIAQHAAHKFPKGALVHLGILNSLRNWNYFEFPEGVDSQCNVGGFGIDGISSTLLGASLADRNRLCFGIIGDLAFFYDLNSLGNRHLGNNVRIMLINNGCGTEFHNYNHPGATFEEEACDYIAADGHFGAKSPNLVRHYAEDLGFEYLTASNKEQFEAVIDRFMSAEAADKPMLLEVFTNSKDESDALQTIQGLREPPRNAIKDAARTILGEKGIKAIKKVMGK